MSDPTTTATPTAPTERQISDARRAIADTPLPPTEREVADVLRAIADTPLPPLEHTRDARAGGDADVDADPEAGRHPHLRTLLQAGAEQGFANRGSLQAFDAGLSGIAREDALLWTLFGQLTADAQYDRQTQPETWYQTYIEALRNIGMNAGAPRWDRVSVSGIRDSVDQTVLSIVKPLVAPQEYALIASVIAALGSGKADEPLTLFNTNASNTSDGNFQVSTGRTDAAANLTVQIEFFYFTTTQRITNMLFWRWTRTDVVLTKGHAELTLPRATADAHRAALRKRLSDGIFENIERIPLAD